MTPLKKGQSQEEDASTRIEGSYFSALILRLRKIYRISNPCNQTTKSLKTP